MQIHMFERFNVNSKACITWKKGIHIGYRTQGCYYMSLYRLNDFYVEIQYHCCHDGIVSVQTFVCEDELEAYLEQIDLSAIFN